jgi:Gluconate 2-dehydrogenase subunit 3
VADERFPGYDVMRERETWDPVTEAAIMARVTPPAVRFFEPDEAKSARALVNLLAGADEDGAVPVLELIADRLEHRRSDGFRFSDMPPDHEAWQASIQALDADAREVASCSFAELDRGQQVKLIEAVRTHEGRWHGLPARRLFSLWMRYVCSAYYSHPAAWNEIGFGGPAYPRGYKNLGLDRLEPWEVPDHQPADPMPWIRRSDEMRAVQTQQEGAR